MAIPDLGKKHDCPNCHSRFFDLGKTPPLCPKCGTEDDDKPSAAAPEDEEDQGEEEALDQTMSEMGIKQSGAGENNGQENDDDDDDEDIDDEEEDGFLMEDTSDLTGDDPIPGAPGVSSQNNDEDI